MSHAHWPKIELLYGLLTITTSNIIITAGRVPRESSFLFITSWKKSATDSAGVGATQGLVTPSHEGKSFLSVVRRVNIDLIDGSLGNSTASHEMMRRPSDDPWKVGYHSIKCL